MDKLSYIAQLSDTLSVPVIENKEPMVELDASVFSIQFRKEEMIPLVGKRIIVRKTLAEKLVRVNEHLNSDNPGCKLLVTYGYRALEVQRKYFNARMEKIEKEFPNESPQQKIERAHAYSAHPDCAGHTCGAAVDLTIWDSTVEEEWDMGSQIAQFDETAQTLFAGLTYLQKQNRLYLQSIMLRERLAPFLGEWWHFSYGDKEWAFFYDEPHAIYDSVLLSDSKFAITTGDLEN